MKSDWCRPLFLFAISPLTVAVAIGFFIQLTTDEGIIGLGERPTGHALDLRAQNQLD